jgi:hypothetical protein
MASRASTALVAAVLAATAATLPIAPALAGPAAPVGSPVSGGSLRAQPPGPRTPPTTRPRRVFVVGDSLTLATLVDGAPAYLPTAVSAVGLALSPVPSAVGGRKVATGLAILAATPHLPDTVLIALGTNNSTASFADAASWIAAARHIVGPSRTILWVNLRMSGERYEGYTTVNAGLLAGVRADNAESLAARRPGRSYVLDWCGYARAAHITNGPDGVHYSVENYALRAAFYARAAARDPWFLAYVLG